VWVITVLPWVPGQKRLIPFGTCFSHLTPIRARLPLATAVAIDIFESFPTFYLVLIPISFSFLLPLYRCEWANVDGYIAFLRAQKAATADHFREGVPKDAPDSAIVDSRVSTLMEMGFDGGDAEKALKVAKNDFDLAVQLLANPVDDLSA
jgi:hypothetical protein